MKKIMYIILVIIFALVILFLAYDYRNTKSPKLFYKVYLNDEVIGVIESKTKLEKFINAQSDTIKNKYKVDNVYGPQGLIIEELSSYNQEVLDVQSAYKTIISLDNLTIDGYQISIKEEDKTHIIYVTKEEVFKEATIGLIKTYVGSENYDKYINNTQEEISQTGSIIKNVYVQNDITIKEMHVPVNEKIYTDAQDLSQYLLYGDNANIYQYTVKLGDTISSISYANSMNPEEFLIANKNFKDVNNLLHVGEQVTVAVPNPQLKVVVEQYQVLDKTSSYITEQRYDKDLYVGTVRVLQEGQEGMIRVSQNVQSINGNITYIEPVAREEIKQPISKIVLIGSQQVPYIGDLNNWAWPTLSGYTITSYFVGRINPITGQREHHSGIDISGTGYGSPIYAANNGIIVTKKYQSDYGYYITINHNNGYWTLYAHMSRFANVKVGDTVARGQLIGYMGMTGWATGPHLHFELWKKCDHCRVDPLSIYE